MSQTEIGRAGAQQTWRSLSDHQQRLLWLMAPEGRFVERAPVAQVYKVEGTAVAPMFSAQSTVRELIEQGLMVWTGPAEDREAAAMPTSLGRFVGRVGTTPPPTHPCHLSPMGYIDAHAKQERMRRLGIRPENCPICQRMKYPDEECAERRAQRGSSVPVLPLDIEGLAARQDAAPFDPAPTPGEWRSLIAAARVAEALRLANQAHPRSSNDVVWDALGAYIITREEEG